MIAIPTWDTASFPAAEQLVAAAVKAAVATDAAIYFFVPSATGWETRPDL